MTDPMTTRFAAASAMILMLAFGAARAADPAPSADAAAAPAPATMAKPAKGFRILDARAFDPSHILPAPPADDSERHAAELAEVQRAYHMPDAGRKALAQWDNDHENASLFAPTLGLKFDMDGLPATAALMDLAQNEASTASGMAKKYFKRTRPWALDKTIIPCDGADQDKPNTSYPSGHASIGWTLAFVLAELMPERAPAILERASDYAYSREICGDHFPSDVEASHALAALVASRLLADPRVADKIEAARAELKAAGIAK